MQFLLVAWELLIGPSNECLMSDDPGNVSLDTLRAYFDERSIGKLSETHPLQSALLQSLYSDDDGCEYFTESRIMKLLEGECDSERKSYSLPELTNSEQIILTALNSLNALDGEDLLTIQDGIELAEDILLATDESISPSVRNTTNIRDIGTGSDAPISAPIPQPVQKAKVRTSSTQTDAPAAIVEQNVPAVKKGSFQSGKDKFLQDVRILVLNCFSCFFCSN